MNEDLQKQRDISIQKLQIATVITLNAYVLHKRFENHRKE